MTKDRDHPYEKFAFLVSLAINTTDEPQAGFLECSGLDAEITQPPGEGTAAGNEENVVTLKRGVVDSTAFYGWLGDIRRGNNNASRTVTIRLQREDRTDVLPGWKLSGACIVKYTSGPLNAKSTEIVIEQLTLSFEKLERE